jgi:glyoxylase-like metal-dependent hydrolase (beta-lactamase superfamily II)
MPRIQVVIIPVTAFQQNCSLVWAEGTRDCLVVDPGGESERILAAIARYDLAPAKILLTHGHLDHAGGAATLQKVLNTRGAAGGAAPVPIIGPDERDRFLLERIEQDAAKHGLPGLRNVTPDRWLAEDDVVELGALRFDVLHCPGHSPGSVVFVERTARFALVGDVLFQGSVGRTDFPYGDGPALIGAIHDKLLPLGDDIRFICGHGPASTFGAERRGNPFLQG